MRGSEPIQLVPNTPEQIIAAAHTVARNATNPADARMILDQLGLYQQLKGIS